MKLEDGGLMARFPHTLGVLAAVVALTASGCTSASPRPSVSRPAPSSPNGAHGDFAGLVDIGGGHKLFLECHGSGSPTVILQSGYGNAGDIWNEADANPPAVAPGVARFTRECAYDRPGSLRVVTDTGTPAPSALPGRSDPAPMPRTAADVTSELHTLLATAGVPGPYVMVSHSFGGLFALLYARTYPEQVTGLVMIDTVTPQMRTALGSQHWQEYQQQAVQQPNEIPGYQSEQYDPDTSIKQIDSAPPLRAMPVAVLIGDTLPTDNTADFQYAMFQALREADHQFAASIPGATLTTVPNTTHYVQTLRPDIVIDAIRDVVERS
jgi:pimeloyl-ACP methyl ester carboxylesterase